MNPSRSQAGSERGRGRDGELGGVSEAEPHGERLDGDGGGDDEPGARGASLAFADCAGRQIVPAQTGARGASGVTRASGVRVLCNRPWLRSCNARRGGAHWRLIGAVEFDDDCCG
jgi:hypothetical protein